VPSEPGPPAVLYAAKSTEDKHGSIPDQLAKTRRLAKAEGWSVRGEFSDEGFSAYSGNRGPDLEWAKAKAIELAQKHGECLLVALHSDRIARGAGDRPGAADHLVEVVAHLRRHGVRLRTVEDDFFADERIGLLMAAVQGQRNSEDSRRKSESVAAGLRRRASERGMFSGPAPYGYAYAEDGSGLAIVAAEAAIVRRIFAEYVAGRSLTAIAQGLQNDKVQTKKGVRWRQSTVSGIVRNPVYVGKVKYKDELFAGTHEPIIGAERWEEAAQLIAAKPSKRGRPPKAKRHLFTGGFLRCAACGDAMCPRTRPESAYEFYECNGRIHGCKTGAIRRADIDGAVLAHFEQTVLDVEATREQVAAAMDRKLTEARALLASAEAEAKDAKARLAKINRDYSHGDLSIAEWRGFCDELEPEEVAARAEVERLREQVKAAESGAAVGAAEAQVIEQLAELRAAIAGDVNAAEGIEAVRAVLQRLFEGFLLHLEVPSEAHVELIGDGYWIEPIVNERAIAGYDEKMKPVLAREPLQQAGDNYGDGSPLR
jgi:DNA invertase Pin-like site-specific DNA recombinase